DDFEAVLGAGWRARLGMTQEEFHAALAAIDPGKLAETGQLSEAGYAARCAACLGFSPAQQEEFIADLWDWYCGELDVELVDFVAGLRPAYRTGILSNSADGARREEQARYGFEDLVDTVIYSHEVGLAKPDPRIYRLACDQLGVEPHEMVFLDDVPQIVAGAAEFGIRAVLHRSTPESIAAIREILTY
ncbi:MAG TPA: HAD-IA family hydrolase, partial [Candidatus Eisenbacteria bacterium]|nr:HAD-IA family hydrolase [Candidatus Eisenbacteria bacterium]